MTLPTEKTETFCIRQKEIVWKLLYVLPFYYCRRYPSLQQFSMSFQHLPTVCFPSWGKNYFSFTSKDFFYIKILVWIRTIFLEQLSLLPLFILLRFIPRVVSESIQTRFLFLDDIKLEDTFQKHILLLVMYFQSMNQTKFKLK